MKKTLTALAIILPLTACSTQSAVETAPAVETAAITAADEASIAAESARLNAWFEDQYEAMLLRSPQSLTRMGRSERMDEWNDVSDENALETFALTEAAYEEMVAEFDFDLLDADTQLSYRLFEYRYEQSRNGLPYRNYGYTFDQMNGAQSEVPAFLINQHQIRSLEAAEAYIGRLNGVHAYMSQQIANAQASAELGIRPPAFVYPYVLNDAMNVLTGYPFGETETMTDSPLMGDFRSKVTALLEDGEITEEQRDALLLGAEAALIDSVGPAYMELISFIEADQQNATTDDGVWRFPDPEGYYASRLERMTTTQLSAADIHALGLSEMERIHGEMEAIMTEVGFEGSLQEFFDFTRTDPQFFYPNTAEGRERYLSEATAMIDTMREALPAMFHTFPEASMIVKAVEPFREQSAGKAFYSRPAPDGSRPGTYYANLYNMGDMPIYQMEALAYHEGIPGHHMQIAIQQEMTQLPSFRRFSGYTAYSEGWGLYSEYFPVEFGFYEDPYSDFGRLAMELWRAARLVVDTGIHDLGWTREEAIDYLLTNTPNPEGDCRKAIERYIVMPGQATAYKIGMLKILELREYARAELGEAFEIAEFHDVVLRNGAVPMAILEELVEEWVAEKQQT
ncbi:DUF885 family protein [Ponticaulis sp.]|uniref:DUF885 domain-containing protein n=1 Tax=Ponticaulis sp. TaxID=2020902 RepID=UPI000B73F724|nr:DUF885 domain-containing protein [Ponticaulis sp.]MAI90472.1 DUF885 domain-containing protein [Ponticaulis sp.]OUY00169.1 MAG: DUF885 domain-containing protein [Hyphomonadaceae bacterium TMED5]|tara:strand:- start:90760 stop:92634 length:1875 start_codon:yes stop_codon:yes gene_type:complete